MPSVEEMRNDPEAREEGLERLSTVSDEHLVALIDEFKKESEDSTQNERSQWQDYFDLWEGWRDYNDKESWQSKIVVEKPFTAVEQATAQIQRALLDSPEFLRAEGTPSPIGISVEFWEQYIRAAFEQAMFIPKYTDCVQMALITGIGSYLKPRWRRFTVPTPQGPLPVSFLSISVIQPWKIYRDPHSKPREQWSGMYIIHSDMIDLHVLEGSGVYTGLEKLVDANLEENKRTSGHDTTRNKDSHRSRFRRQYLVDEYWGDVLDEGGHLVATDVLMAKCGKVLIRPPDAMPHKSWDTNTGRQRWPLISCSPFTHPHRFEGRGLLQQFVDLALSYENGFNLSADAMNWKINNPAEFDTNLMANPTDTKVVPGKGFARKVTSSGSSVQPLRFSQDINIQEILSYLEYIDKNIQNNSFVNEFVVGLPGYRSDITKGEVQIKTAQSMAIFDRMGRSIELAGKNFAELVYDMLVQYTDQSTIPVIGGLLDPMMLGAIVGASPEERQVLMRADLQLNFIGVSQALQRSDQLRRLMQISVIAGNPLFVGRLENPSDLMRAMIDLLGYSDKIKVSDQPTPPPGTVPELGREGVLPGASGAPPRGVGEPPRVEKLSEGQDQGLPPEQGLFAGNEGGGEY
jgi:hypothetical protein